MDFNALARLAKLVALLGFLLPWVVVSCSNTEILSATGLQLMTGDIHPAGFADAQQSGDDKPDPNPLVIALFVLIVVAVGASLVTKARVASAILLVGALGGVGLAFYTIEDMRAGFERQVEKRQHDSAARDSGGFLAPEQANQLQAQVAGMIRIEKQEGFWVTVIALAAAALMALLALTGIRLTAAPAPPRPQSG